MRSSSSAWAKGGVATSNGEFDRWTPEAIAPPREIPTPEEIEEALADAVRIAVEEAEARAREHDQARREEDAASREAIAREAYERGFAEGREEGEKAEAARLRTAVNAAGEALDELRDGEVRWTGTIEENICALSAVIARQILGRELALDIEPLADLVRWALDEFPIDQPIRIRINPSDLNAITSVGGVESDPLQAIAADREARWFPDSSIAPGGCVVEGRERIIDGRVDTALERVYRRLTYTNA